MMAKALKALKGRNFPARVKRSATPGKIARLKGVTPFDCEIAAKLTRVFAFRPDSYRDDNIGFSNFYKSTR